MQDVSYADVFINSSDPLHKVFIIEDKIVDKDDPLVVYSDTFYQSDKVIYSVYLDSNEVTVTVNQDGSITLQREGDAYGGVI